MKTDSDRQLDMSYAGDDRFSRLLKSSTFFTMLELHDTRKNSPGTLRRELLEQAAAEPEIRALLVDDRLLDPEDDGAFELIQESIVRTEKPVVAVISGKDALRDNVVSKLNRRRTANVRDFLAVTGNLLHAQHEAGIAVPPGEYEDSIRILRTAAESGADNCVGVTVNPFKYTPEDQMAQYAKLMRKVNNGAEYIVSQAGWDMRKYQELLWFLHCRSVMKPLLARVLLWSGSSKMQASMPGVPVSLKTATTADVPGAALEMTALVALGCRLMGYSGVILAGIEDASTLKALLEKIREYEEKWPEYKVWCSEWNRRYGETSFIPYSETLSRQPGFYLYGALMDPEKSDFDPMEARPAMQDIREPSLKDRMQLKVHGTDWPDWIKRTAGKFTGSDPDDAEYLAPCFGLNNEECPKRLVLGPCGGSFADGTCECGGLPCFFQRVIRLAHHGKLMEALEDSGRVSE